MSASLQPLRLDEFLDWEHSQEERYEFDGIQPVAMTGGSRPHSDRRVKAILELWEVGARIAMSAIYDAA